MVTDAEGTDDAKKKTLPIFNHFFPGKSKVYKVSKNTKKAKTNYWFSIAPTIHKSTLTVINNDFLYSDTQLEAFSQLSAFSHFILDFKFSTK